jgi:acyl carrier protein
MAEDLRAVIDRHLAALVERGVDLAALGPETSLREDLGLSSLEAVTLLIGVEEDLDVEISDDEVARLQTLGDLTTLLEGKLAARDAS